MRHYAKAMTSLILISTASASLHAAEKSAILSGEFLYSKNCVACHTAQIHWRDKGAAKNWDELVRQVGRWESIANLHWSDKEIHDVSEYLNTRYYHFPSDETEGAIPHRRSGSK